MSALKEQMDSILKEVNEKEALIKKLEKEVVEGRSVLRQLNTKQKAIDKIMKKYPGQFKIDAFEVTGLVANDVVYSVPPEIGAFGTAIQQNQSLTIDPPHPEVVSQERPEDELPFSDGPNEEDSFWNADGSPREVSDGSSFDYAKAE